MASMGDPDPHPAPHNLHDQDVNKDGPSTQVAFISSPYQVKRATPASICEHIEKEDRKPV